MGNTKRSVKSVSENTLTKLKNIFLLLADIEAKIKYIL